MEGEIGTEQTQIGRATLDRLPHDVRSVGIIIIATFVVFFVLYVAKEVFLPIVFAMVLKLLLQPVVRFLRGKLHLPRTLAALLVILAVFCVIAGIGFTISVPARNWVAKAPQTFSVLKERLQILAKPIDELQHTMQQVGSIARPREPGTPTVTVQQTNITSYVFSGTRAVVTGFFTMIVVLFFMLGSGDTFLRRLVEVLPRFSEKKQAIEISDQIEANISIYLVTITIMNSLVGIAVGAASWLEGLGDPLLWGTAAFLLNYIPILGPMAGVVIFFIVGLLSFNSAWMALLPAGTYLLIHVIEGETVTPMLLARRFTLNPVLVIISLIFWDWMWGIVGAILAVPLLAIFKIVCDHIEMLMPLGHFIGTDERPGPTSL